MALFSGTCEGGPLRGLKLHHGEPLYYVARNTLTGRIRIRNLAYPMEDYEVGHYEFHVDSWHWHSPLRKAEN